MSKKQTKVSENATTEGKDIPEQVQWLLDFFNINSIPGEYNPRKLLYSKRPDRTPTVPPENPETGYITDHKGYIYVPSFDNEPECIGKEGFFPTSDGFRKYFESCNIRNASIVENEDMFQRISGLWNDLSMAFARIVTANQPIDTDRKLREGIVIDIDKELEIGQSIIESHCRSYLDNYDIETQLRIARGDWFPDIKGLPDIIYIGILTWSKCEEIRTLLRQCLCCGAFRIDQPKRGKPRVYCKNKKCGNVINAWDRKKDSDKKKEYRKHQIKIAKPKIIQYLMKDIYEKNKDGFLREISKVRAEEIYEEEKQNSPNNVSSLAEFIRTCSRNYYLKANYS